MGTERERSGGEASEELAGTECILLGKRIRGVVFDLDGTLVDAFEDIAAAVNFALLMLGLPRRGYAEIRGFVGNGILRLAERAAGAGNELLAPRMAELITAYYREHSADHARPYPGAVETLRWIHSRGLRTGVLSNKRHELTVMILDQFGMSPHLDVIQGERPELGLKPDPRVLAAVLERLGLEADAIAFVGDGEPDAQLSRATGALFVGVSYGLLPRNRLEALGARVVLDDIRELIGLLGG
jgi:phosphoglycolate phosphatase